jgi:CDP-glucose 4,6-dehydratase
MGKMVVAGHLSVFNNKRILVTGDTGFKGSWLCLWLHMLGADIIGYSLRPDNEACHFNTSELSKYISHIDGDIRDMESLKKVFRDFQPEFLFHLAAQSLVRASYSDPKLTFDTNVGGSVNILELVRDSSSLRSVIYVTSDKCYKNREWVWGYRENDELGGHDPYSASKAAAEIVFGAYYDSFFSKRLDLGIASVRAGNVIGGGDWSVDRIVPDTIRAILNNKPVIIRNPSSIRPWQHVIEPLYGYLLLAANLHANPKEFSGSWNFGPESLSIRTTRELAEKMISFWGKGEVRLKRKKGDLHESRLLRLYIDKAMTELKWRPKWDFNTTVKLTVQWYKYFSHSRSTLSISKEQINKYMEDCNDRRG